MGRRSLVFAVFLALLISPFRVSPATANTSAQPLPFSQSWTDTTLITTNDDWSGVPGIVGYLGDDGTPAVTGVDPQTILTEFITVDVIANQTSTALANGGVAEFELADPVVALQGSGTADAPHLVLTLDTTGASSVTVAYNLRDIDGSLDNAAQPVALQYRIGTTGNYTNVPTGFVADATSGPSLATLVTPVSASLPAAAGNQPVIQVRIITTNAAGSDEWVGIDDITVTSTVAPDSAPTVSTTSPANGATGVAVNANITVTFSEPVNVASGWYAISCATSGAHTAIVSGGPTTFTLDPAADFAASETCTLNIASGQVRDQDANDPPDALAADHVVSFTVAGSAALSPQPLPFFQGWTDSGLITTSDNWSGVPGIIGYRGDDLTTATGTDPQAIMADGSATPVNVIPNQINTAITNGGIAEFHLVDPVVALQGSGTADAPHLVITLDTRGASNVRVAYNLRDIDGTVDDAVQAVALQYRIGAIGTYTNVPAGFVADATSGPSLATLVTPVSISLPAAAADQPIIQVRIITTNAVGSDEWVGIDDIAVTVADAPPTVSSTSPANGATGVALGANITVAFSEPVTVSGSWHTISCTTSESHTATAIGGPTSFTLDPSADFAASETCTVTIVAAQVSDQDASPPDVMAANFVFTFRTSSPPLPIRAIQGASHVSPENGQTVSTSGIVTAKRNNGFYLQDPSPDADDATSEAILVFTSSSPTVNVGDSVTVSGTVAEFRAGGGSSTNLTITEITSPTIVALSAGNPLPAPIVIGPGGRLPPTETIDNDATGDVETSGTFDPAMDGIDFYESLEAMRLQLNDAEVVGPTNGFGETAVVVNGGLRTARGGVIIASDDFNPERVILDNEAGTTYPAANVGDRYAGALIGVLDYSFGNFKLHVTQPLTLSAGAIDRETTLPAAAGELAVATFNVENLDANEPASKFELLADLIVDNLASPDIVALEEVQDNNGATNDAVVAASETLSKLVAAISAAGGPTYDWRQIDPVDDQDGGEPGGNIRVAFLFRTDRGLTFVDRPGGDATTATTVTGVTGAPELSVSPGRIDPNNAAFNTSRKPLAGEFRFSGVPLFVIANHFNSKGGDHPLFGRFQPPVRVSETQRHQQANIVASFVEAILAQDPNARVIVAGDINDFEFSETTTILRDGGLTPLMDTLDAAERYSYVFEGNSQTLDQILVSDALLNILNEFDVVHVNAEFADQTSDHDPQVARFAALDTTAPTITAPPPVTVDASASCVVEVDDATLGTGTASDDSGSVTITRSGVPAGNVFPLGSTIITYTATDPSGNTATATQNVAVVDHTPPTITAPADVNYQTLGLVPAPQPGDATAADNCGTPVVTVFQTSNGGAGTPASPLVLARTYTATDGSGNTASDTQTITVIDTTPPTITGIASPAANANGWNAGPVTVHFTCADNSDSVTCPSAVTISTQGAGQSVTGTATDPSGNATSTTVGPINIDTTAPSIVFGGSLAYTVDQTVAITCTATDVLSGLDPAVTQTCQTASGPAYAFGTGAHTLNASATDLAGNTIAVTATFTVGVTGRSLCQLLPSLVGRTEVAVSLCALALGAERANDRGLHLAHDALLMNFERTVNRERGDSITNGDADLLIALARLL
jgi:predicted extracellular nuclease